MLDLQWLEERFEAVRTDRALDDRPVDGPEQQRSRASERLTHEYIPGSPRLLKL